MSALGGLSNANRIKDICERAHRWLAAGQAAEDVDECHCYFEDGSPKYVNPEGRKVHCCGK